MGDKDDRCIELGDFGMTVQSAHKIGYACIKHAKDRWYAASEWDGDAKKVDEVSHARL
jgi:hypothetical protein